jgi:hypothetical protein
MKSGEKEGKFVTPSKTEQNESWEGNEPGEVWRLLNWPHKYFLRDHFWKRKE